MSSAGTRERLLPLFINVPGQTASKDGGVTWNKPGKTVETKLADGGQKTVSESHSRDHRTGNYYSGGPFYTSRVTYFVNPGYTRYPLVYTSGSNTFRYSGPLCGKFPTSEEMSKVGFTNPTLKFGDDNSSSLRAKGATAIHLSSPTNNASDLGTTLAETFREGVPSLPGIQTWRRRTAAAKAAGSEYLNYQFGWAPLLNEVHQVRDAARNHRDIMNHYHSGEGTNTRRSFTFPSSSSSAAVDMGTEWPLLIGAVPSSAASGQVIGHRRVSRFRETKCWFEGCYTYGLPSSSDSWRKAIGFGSDADQLFGLALTPEVLWELTPWSWAVDWFSNAGDVISNVTQFGLAGLVLRYGYIMEESIERVTASVDPSSFYRLVKPGEFKGDNLSTTAECGVEVVTKRRVPASPFGFSVGWEDLSPTQLAITAALGITKLL